MKTDSNINLKSGYIVAGLMSGTSLDGVDVAFCAFDEHKGNWHFEILAAKTFRYNDFWYKNLCRAHMLSGEQLIKLDRIFGDHLGNIVNIYGKQTGIQPMLISSHGHTVFHNPAEGYTCQIGCGANIAARTGVPVVSDFRTADIARGGQGAPLVPLGDKLLFSEYDACLNLGGFANISFDFEGRRIAFDICPVNNVINKLAHQYGNKYDKNGIIGRNGSVNIELLASLDSIKYYKKAPPKSLSREWLEEEFMIQVDNSGISLENNLATVYEHIVHQISKVIDKYAIKRVLVTGGGAFNRFLMELMKKEIKAEIILPDKSVIKYKEALIFGCLGLLRVKNKINCLSSVTGASNDSVCGVLHMP